MKPNTRIRIVKKAERKSEQSEASTSEQAVATQATGETVDEAVTTITGWISELRRQQKQKNTDAVRNFENLFRQAA